MIKLMLIGSIILGTSTELLAFKPLSVWAATLRYGPIVSGTWKEEKKWMIRFKLPSGYEHLSFATTGKPVRVLYVNRDLSVPLSLVLKELVLLGLNKEIKTFSGCFSVRQVRGRSSRLSAHSYGLACDFNSDLYPLGSHKRFDPRIVQVFNKYGWKYGGDFLRRPDPHHFSYSWE